MPGTVSARPAGPPVSHRDCTSLSRLCALQGVADAELRPVPGRASGRHGQTERPGPGLWPSRRPSAPAVAAGPGPEPPGPCGPPPAAAADSES